MDTLASLSAVAANLATAVGIVVAVWTGIIAYRRHREEMDHQRWLDAKSLYVSALDDLIKNPSFSGESWSKVKGNIDESFRYSIFVNKLLWSLEGMLKVDGADEEWKRSTKMIAGDYRDFLNTDIFRREAFLFSVQLRSAIEEGTGLIYKQLPPSDYKSRDEMLGAVE